MPIKHAGVVLQHEDYKCIKMEMGDFVSVITVFMTNGSTLAQSFNIKSEAQIHAQCLMSYKKNRRIDRE